MAAGKFVVKKSRSGKFHFNLLATNGQVVASSEMYESKAAALKGIASIRSLAADAKLVDDSDGAVAAKKAAAKKTAAKKATAKKAPAKRAAKKAAAPAAS